MSACVNSRVRVFKMGSPLSPRGPGAHLNRTATCVRVPVSMQSVTIPDKPLSNFELERYAKLLKIPNLRGVFMRDLNTPNDCQASRVCSSQ